jgi:hypothetical protein
LTKLVRRRFYCLFDRVLLSEVEIHLLPEIASPPNSTVDMVSLLVSDEPVRHVGEPTFGGPLFGVTHYEVAGRGVSVLNDTGYVAVTDPDGLTVTVHPHAHWNDSTVPANPRRIADTLVTVVLNRLPILWGAVALHAATLETPGGSVLLLGLSGHGKSTLSQQLSRDFGWVVHDDDTVMLVKDNHRVGLVPMGAAPRLRADAAERLRLEGTALPGYAGGKTFVPPLSVKSQTSTILLGLPIAIFSLSPGEQARPPSLEIAQPYGVRDILWRSFLPTSNSTSHRSALFRAVETLANIPLNTVHYQKHTDTPEEIAQLISRAVG